MHERKHHSGLPAYEQAIVGTGLFDFQHDYLVVIKHWRVDVTLAGATTALVGMVGSGEFWPRGWPLEYVHGARKGPFDQEKGTWCRVASGKPLASA